MEKLFSFLINRILRFRNGWAGIQIRAPPPLPFSLLSNQIERNKIWKLLFISTWTGGGLGKKFPLSGKVCWKCISFMEFSKKKLFRNHYRKSIGLIFSLTKALYIHFIHSRICCCFLIKSLQAIIWLSRLPVPSNVPNGPEKNFPFLCRVARTFLFRFRPRGWCSSAFSTKRGWKSFIFSRAEAGNAVLLVRSLLKNSLISI